MKNIISCSKRFFLSLIAFCFCFYSFNAQDEWDFDESSSVDDLGATFNDTRVVNGHSVETLEA